MIKNFLHLVRTRIRAEMSFHFFVDVISVVASLATVYTLMLFLHDRPEQANVMAWQLLQSYLQTNPHPQAEVGQGFALQTLVKNEVDLSGIDAHGIFLSGVDLNSARFISSNFVTSSNLSGAHFDNVNFRKATLTKANLNHAMFVSCNCQHADFEEADLSSSALIGGNFLGANFRRADISDLRFDIQDAPMWLFENACFREGHEPVLGALHRPVNPQAGGCNITWGVKWDKENVAQGEAN